MARALVVDTMKYTRAIGWLIDACIDDERMLEHESRIVHGHRREVLERLRDEQAAVVERLKGLHEADGRRHDGSMVELGRETGRTLRGLLGGSNPGDAVSACRRSCRRTATRFDEVLELPWSPETRAVLADAREHLDAASHALVSIQY